MMKLYFDIETIPTTNKLVIDKVREGISPPGNYKNADTIQKWMDESGEEAFQKEYRKTALDGLYGEIISIAWALDESPVDVIYRGKESDKEADVLAGFLDAITHVNDRFGNIAPITKWIGHYICGFDLRFLWQRCVINGIKPEVKIPYDAKPWDSNVFDTKIAWTGASQYSGSGSLDALALVMFGEGKREINGANVYDYWMRGEYKIIADYNKRDVEMCRNLYKKMNFLDI
jgi:3'-5' exonuclease